MKDKDLRIDKSSRPVAAGKWRCPALTTGLALLLSGCTSYYSSPGQTGTPYMFEPSGRTAERIADLWWVMLYFGIFVFLLVTSILLFTVIVKARQRRDLEVNLNPASGMGWIWLGGILLPSFILFILFLLNFRVLDAITAPASETPIRIDVVGNQWWWEVRYPDYGFITANEIHLPVDYPVQVHLTSADVIHTFWVPQLAGKIDLIPGKTTHIQIEATEAGIYRGICAEFCGAQHANMAFIVVAEDERDFLSWVEGQMEPASEPDDQAAQEGLQVFLTSGCPACHTISGLQAAGKIGPDLTHLASRRTIAAGMLENTRGSLAGWIVDPQGVKPGNYMPPIEMSSQDIQVLLDFLMTLE